MLLRQVTGRCGYPWVALLTYYLKVTLTFLRKPVSYPLCLRISQHSLHLQTLTKRIKSKKYFVRKVVYVHLVFWGKGG